MMTSEGKRPLPQAGRDPNRGDQDRQEASWRRVQVQVQHLVGGDAQARHHFRESTLLRPFSRRLVSPSETTFLLGT
jgi:hypothetical protein